MHEESARVLVDAGVVGLEVYEVTQGEDVALRGRACHQRFIFFQIHVQSHVLHELAVGKHADSNLFPILVSGGGGN